MRRSSRRHAGSKPNADFGRTASERCSDAAKYGSADTAEYGAAPADAALFEREEH